MQESARLAEFCADLQFADLPESVVQRLLELTLDWTGSALAGSVSRQCGIFRKFAVDMGPTEGPCRVFGSPTGSSPMFAALCNAAASHVVEQDDLHNSSVFHPATVVFPPLLAAAQSLPACSGTEFLAAAAAGYESGIRVGEFLGRSHYQVFHTTGTAGTIAAAMAVARLLGLNAEQTRHALGSAGTQAAGLWEFLRDAADSKQLHTAGAAANGLMAAWTARDGLTGASRILEGDQGIGKAMLGEGDPSMLTAALGSRWGLAETSFKYHASCRHTHPAADAMLSIRERESLDPSDVSDVTVHVYRAAREVLGAVDVPETVHQAKFSMGFVLGLILFRGSAGVADFSEESLADPALREFTGRVRMVEDDRIEAMYPRTWCARVDVRTHSGEVHSVTVDAPRGDPENPLTPEELDDKVRLLASHYSACDAQTVERIIRNCRRLPEIADMRYATSP